MRNVILYDAQTVFTRSRSSPRFSRGGKRRGKRGGRRGGRREGSGVVAEHRYSESAEELLEHLYIKTIELEEPALHVTRGSVEIVEELKKSELIIVEAESITLSLGGIAAGRLMVRRHRLAERLLTDILGSGGSTMHDQACRFEHVLNDGIDEQICTLLGHPKVCPHGQPIPEGACCKKRINAVNPVVVSMSEMKKRDGGTVAYINAPETEILNKLMAMGVVPGASLEIIQTYPSFVFRADQSQFAVDQEIADTIFVRVTR